MQETYLRTIKVKIIPNEVKSPKFIYDPYSWNFLSFDYDVYSYKDAQVKKEFAKALLTFEGLDSHKISRGEYLPYYTENLNSRWINEVINSDWLNQRHEYEYKHYKYSLLEEYSHYLFSFHDEFVEVIAKGFWIEKANNGIEICSEEHPLNNLPLKYKVKDLLINGRKCILVENPLSIEGLIENSKLCSQKLFQYYIVFEDGTIEPDYYASIRTRNDITITKFESSSWEPILKTKEGIAKISDFENLFIERVNKCGSY